MMAAAGLPPDPPLDPTINPGQGGHTSDHEVISTTLGMLKPTAGMSIEEVQSALVDGGLAEDPAFTGTFAPADPTELADLLEDEFAPAGDSLWVPARSFGVGIEGTPSEGSVSGVPCWLMDADALETVTAVVRVPSHWVTVDVAFLVAKVTSGTGAITPRWYLTSFAAGETPAGGPSNGTAMAWAAAQGIPALLPATTGAAVNSAKWVKIAMGRGATSGGDTMTGDVAYLGALLTMAS